VVVVGAGVGGLAAAILLAAKGIAVTLLEKEATPGGKMREVVAGGRAMDAGPTVFTMRAVFESLFAAAGTRLSDHVTLTPASVLARHAWPDGSRLDLFADRARSVDAIGAFAGPEEARRYLAFSDRAKALHDRLEKPFLHAAKSNPFGMAMRVGPLGGLSLLKAGAMLPLWKALGLVLKDQRLRQLYGRYATYCGASPFHAPALLMLIAHVEESGVWLVEGGMHQLALAMARVAHGLGVETIHGAEAAEILVASSRASGVRTKDGRVFAADAVVFAGDASALGEGLLGEGARPAAPAVGRDARSLSAVTWNITAPTAGFPLERHTVFFSSDYAREFREIFDRRRLPTEPTVYVCAQDRGEGATPKAGETERLLVLVNAPADGDTRNFDQGEMAACERATFGLLQRAGLSVQVTQKTARVTTPADFARLFPGTGGAIYGRAIHGFFGAFRRPGALSRLPGLHLAGGSVHPGPGVPMAALSGFRVAESVLSDFASTNRFPRTATSGGTSTGRATTAAMPSR
jgi:1-hydroxycarotenoid 3,4-desaturase